MNISISTKMFSVLDLLCNIDICKCNYGLRSSNDKIRFSCRPTVSKYVADTQKPSCI